MTASIPRSTGSGRGPTKPRRQPGDMQCAAPVARQVTTITLTVEQLEGGRLRFTLPRAPGWAAVASSPSQAVVALRSAFTEAQVAAHSLWRGHVYDEPSAYEYRRHKPKSRGARRCDVYAPTEWMLRDDGLWQSPKGFKFREDTQVVQRVMTARQQLGLAARPDPLNPDTVEIEERSA